MQDGSPAGRGSLVSSSVPQEALVCAGLALARRPHVGRFGEKPGF